MKRAGLIVLPSRPMRGIVLALVASGRRANAQERIMELNPSKEDAAVLGALHAGANVTQMRLLELRLPSTTATRKPNAFPS
jgi:hypothetical protein